MTSKQADTCKPRHLVFCLSLLTASVSLLPSYWLCKADAWPRIHDDFTRVGENPLLQDKVTRLTTLAIAIENAERLYRLSRCLGGHFSCWVQMHHLPCIVQWKRGMTRMVVLLHRMRRFGAVGPGSGLVLVDAEALSIHDISSAESNRSARRRCENMLATVRLLRHQFIPCR